MFFTFLNKGEANCLELSIIRKYPPDKILYYYYNATITFPLETYLELINNVNRSRNLSRWERLLKELDVTEDLEHFQHNEYLNEIGPYYYAETNTRIYFTKDYIAEESYLTIEDFELLNSLETTPTVSKVVQNYHKSRKRAKKAPENKEELLKDIEICIKSFTETELLNQHINYINKLLESRYSIVEENDLQPLQPDKVPEKPQAINVEIPEKSNVIPFTKLKIKRKNDLPSGASFNHDTKVYLIRYKEYEKACERYKNILSDWPDLYQVFLEKCYSDIDEAEKQLKKANLALGIYNFIIQKSFIHADYQDLIILEKFKYYLETGRADNLQDCMNLFEDEKYWKDIRDSQDRIENTIYFLQSETDLTRFADENITQYLKQFNEAAASMDEFSD